MRLEHVATLLEPERLPYLSGVERLPDGVLHVAVLTRMPEVSPEMFAWWFDDYLETTEHYKRWHPRDHVWMQWADKKPGTHIGAKHLVHETIGGRLQKLRIAFVPPTDFFGNTLETSPGARAICGRTGFLERPLDVGHLVHLAIPRAYGTELHSRFWLGHAKSRNGSSLVERAGNTSIVRRALARMSFGRALALHCHEEMTTLAGFLPELWGEARSTEPI